MQKTRIPTVEAGCPLTIRLPKEHMREVEAIVKEQRKAEPFGKVTRQSVVAHLVAIGLRERSVAK